MTRSFRARLVLLALGWYAYGDHVSDPRAFGMRLARMQGRCVDAG